MKLTLTMVRDDDADEVVEALTQRKDSVGKPAGAEQTPAPTSGTSSGRSICESEFDEDVDRGVIDSLLGETEEDEGG